MRSLNNMKTPKNSLFVVLDGIDSSGKSEMLSRLHNYIFSLNKKYRILTTREPTYGRYGAKAREILKKDKNPQKNASKCLELFVKDRKEHLSSLVVPFLTKKNGKNINVVLCDRYYYSTIAFQSTQGLNMRKVIERNKKFLRPTLSFILDLPVGAALERLGNRGDAKEKFEHREFMTQLRRNFLDLPKYLSDNIVIVDASRSKEEVFEDIRKEVIRYLRK